MVHPAARKPLGFCHLHLREQADTTTHRHGQATAGETHLATALAACDLLRGWLRRLDREEVVGKGEGSSGIPPAEILKIGEEGLETPP